MSIKSPSDIENASVNIIVKINGSPIKDYYPVSFINIKHQVNRHSSAELVIIDGSVDQGSFPISDSGDFLPGKEIEILAGYGDESKQIFIGIIAKQGLRINREGRSDLIITSKSKELLDIGTPDLSTQPVFRVAYGESIIAFEAKLAVSAKGEVTHQGCADALPGKMIELAGVGLAFNGNVLVTAATHELAEGDWKTVTGFGLDDEDFEFQVFRDVDKSIVTRFNLKLSFDDDKKAITIETPGGNIITLSDDEKLIEIMDQNLNKVIMNSSGISMDSPKDIVIKSSGDIKLDAAGKIEIKANMDATTEAMNITQCANVAYTAKGNASAELSASGQKTVKGAMVIIN